ncbi:MAG TPA: hypothetical protein VGC62_11855 [Pseudomonas sp.]|uniref:hypothetical protein n=1 Tax=Pseudomonas sp. TaxID=306 RepID=UPI002EDA308C
MLMIDRYELTLEGHEHLLHAQNSLRLLDSYIERADAASDPNMLKNYATTVRAALDKVVDDALAVDGRDAFMRQACDWGFTALAPIERVLIQSLRSCSIEGAKEIHQMVERTVERKPYVRTDI